jgi:hypothetical protein
MTDGEGRRARLSSEWLIQHIREHGGVMTVRRELVVE